MEEIEQILSNLCDKSSITWLLFCKCHKITCQKHNTMWNKWQYFWWNVSTDAIAYSDTIKKMIKEYE